MKIANEFEDTWKDHGIQPGDLFAYWEIIQGRVVLDEVEDFDLALVERHISSCPRCAQELLEWEATSRILEQDYVAQIISSEENEAIEALVDSHVSRWRSELTPVAPPMDRFAAPEAEIQNFSKTQISPQPEKDLAREKAPSPWERSRPHRPWQSMLGSFGAPSALKWAPVVGLAALLIMVGTRQFGLQDPQGGVRGTARQKLPAELKLEQSALLARPRAGFSPPLIAESLQRADEPVPLQPIHTVIPSGATPFEVAPSPGTRQYVLFVSPIQGNKLTQARALQSSTNPRFQIPEKQLRPTAQWLGWWVESRLTNGRRKIGPLSLIKVLPPQAERQMKDELNAFRFPKSEPEIRKRARYLFEFKTYLQFGLMAQARQALNGYGASPGANTALVDKIRQQNKWLTTR